jgi:hypothetical protein
MLPGDVADPPVVLDLDEIEHDDGRLVGIAKLDRRPGFVRCRRIGKRDVDRGDIPVLRVDEGSPSRAGTS